MQLLYTLLLSCLLTVSTTKESQIIVTISGISKPTGRMQIGLYNSEEYFLKKLYQGKSQKVEKLEIQETFTDIPAGTYAISIFHDENGNGQLDSNLFRIPKEPYGFSNNPSTTFGPPDFEGAAFIHRSGQITHIKIQLK